jgi:hypothetical protein
MLDFELIPMSDLTVQATLIEAVSMIRKLLNSSMIRVGLGVVLAAAIVASIASAENWPRYRGGDGTGAKETTPGSAIYRARGIRHRPFGIGISS